MNFANTSRWRSQRGGAGLKILVIFFLIGVIVLFLLARGCYQMAQEVFTPKTSKTSPDPNRFAFPVVKCPDFPADQAAQQRAAQASARVPLVHGLIVDGVLTLEGKDIEGLHQFTSDDDNSLTFTYSGSGFSRNGKNVTVNKAFKTNPYAFCRSEIPASPVYVGRMYDKHPDVFASGTYQQLSWKAFNALKDRHLTIINLHTHAYMKSGQLAFQGNQNIILRRNDDGQATFRVIINDTPTDLPVITAEGTPQSGVGDSKLKFAALDDPVFPLILDWEWIGDRDINKVVKITFPVQKKIEKDLADEGRAEIYGIYFDFDSDEIRSESEPVLAEIADALNHHLEWKLNVEGHTDNVGGDKHNLDLSQRRAASVINALASRYQIAADRLTPAGYGASKPKATNDTAEGRALNRRVELVRK